MSIEMVDPRDLSFRHLGMMISFTTRTMANDERSVPHEGVLAAVEARRSWRDVPGTSRRVWDIGVFLYLERDPQRRIAADLFEPVAVWDPRDAPGA